MTLVPNETEQALNRQHDVTKYYGYESNDMRKIARAALEGK